MPDTTTADQEIARLEAELAEKVLQLAKLRQERPPEPVKDYELQTPDGPVKLSQLFGDKKDLIVIHNMGQGCPYCTMWADGFNGLLAHLENRAAFVVVSGDEPARQKAFAEGRGWKFRMASAKGSTFSLDLGYEYADGSKLPGFSTFSKSDDGTVQREGHGPFGPGDVFNPAWHFLDALKDGANGWEPKFRY